MAQIWSTSIKANTADSGPGGNDQTQPSIVRLGDGFLAVWADNSFASGALLKAQKFGFLGQKLGGEFIVSNSFNPSSGGASLSALPDGGFVVARDDALDAAFAEGGAADEDGAPKVLERAGHEFRAAGAGVVDKDGERISARAALADRRFERRRVFGRVANRGLKSTATIMKSLCDCGRCSRSPRYRSSYTTLGTHRCPRR